jgi:glycopeptide antibiotics resistance protein
MLENDWRFAKRLLIIFGLTLTFEVLQYIFALGRSDITDVIGNTLGGLIGMGIYALLAQLFKSKTPVIVSILAAIVTVCVTARFVHLFYLSHFVMGRPGL